MIIGVVLTWILSFSLVHGYFYAPNLINTLPFKGGMAYAQRNNSLILYGGENATTSYTNDLYVLTPTSTGFSWQVLPQTNPSNGTLYGQAAIINAGADLLLLGGMSQTTSNQNVPLYINTYNFVSQTWQATNLAANASANNTATNTVLNRMMFSATPNAAGDKIYIYAGAVNMTEMFNDLWVLDVPTMTFTALPPSDMARYGHTASMLSNGKLVIIGGVAVMNNNGQMSSMLAPMNQLYVFDTTTSSWAIQTITGQVPSTRSSHNAVTTTDDKIVIFGGDNGADIRNRMYLNAVAILDTHTWTWTIPSVQGIPPSRRSYAAAGLYNNQLVVAFGEALNTYYNDINVFSLSDSAWLQAFGETTNGDGSSGISTGIIVGVALAATVLLVIILFLLWRFQSYIRWLVTRINRDIWKPRTGEPVWAETARLISQFVILVIFVFFLAFVIRQAVTSPNVTERIIEPAAQVDTPDVRFCFDGYPTYPDPNDPRNPGVVCQTDNGYPCTQYILPLDMGIFTPTFADNLGQVTCFLFRPASDFQLTATSGANNGSRLLFTFFADQSITYGRIHVSSFPKAMDPNVKIYNIQDNTPVIMSDADVLNWQNGERNDIQVANMFTIEPFTYSAMSYNLIDYRYLQPVGWNNVGFMPITNSTPVIETSFRQEAPNPNYTAGHADIGVFTVFPTEFSITTARQVKMYTLLNAIGFVGGVFGLLLAAQAWLFGYRPRSPWGVVHRWSMGEMKKSLLRGLSNNFRTTNSGAIPLVQPVHHRFSASHTGSEPETTGQRVARMEERMQVLELLFKSYYVDDEVFRSLDNANRQYAYGDNGNDSNGRTLFYSTEKHKTYGCRDEGLAFDRPRSSHSRDDLTRHDSH